MNNVKGLLIDIDGVLLVDDKPIEGAIDKLNELKEKYTFRLVTNTTTKAKKTLLENLQKAGIDVINKELFTTPEATINVLTQMQVKRIYPLVNEAILPEFDGFIFDKENPEVIVIGDIGNCWNYQLLNEIFNLLMHGTEIVALHKGKFWKTNNQLQVDIGLFVNGLEFVSSKKARVIGKPSADFFLSAMESMQLKPEQILMIGDDIENDIGGAQQIGINGCLVKTGKYNADFVQRSAINPNQIVESFAHLIL